MGVLTSQKIAALYERYREIDVVYTKEIVQVTGLQSKQIYLKCVSDVWPCVIYSSSFQGAKIAVNIKSGLIPKLQQANNMVSLRFCFKDPFQEAQVTFFVSARSLGYTPHKGSEDVGLFTIQFTQRPSDDLIEIMGRLLDANVNSTRRKGERVLITAETLRKLNLRSSECAVFIQGVPRRCILRDISFAGARIIIQGVVKFLLEKEAALRIDFDDPRESFLVNGKFTQAETVAFRKDMVVLNLAFVEGQIPMGYKVRINEYFATIRPGGEGEGAAKAPDTAAVSTAAVPAPAADSGPAAEAAAGDKFSIDDEPEKPRGDAAKPAKPAAGGKS
ncbi:MAG: pilus assembly protein PilZ [Treponema sp.]|jgi:hypothetical protein|nr:pilus assembly protein PilZ [Treponema sp.]